MPQIAKLSDEQDHQDLRNPALGTLTQLVEHEKAFRRQEKAGSLAAPAPRNIRPPSRAHKRIDKPCRPGGGGVLHDMRHLIAGNWKMNGLAASLDEAALIAEGADALKGRGRRDALPAGDA